MPKGTVTLSIDGLPASKPASHSALRAGLIGLPRRCYLLLLPIVGREAWLLGGLAFLLGRVAFLGELAPFGLAFFAAVVQVARHRALGVAVWAVAGALSVGRYSEAGLNLVIILLYFRLRDKLPSLQYRVSAAPLFIFSALILGGSMIVLWHSGTLYDYLLAVFNAVACLALSYIFMFGVRLLTAPPGERHMNAERLVCLVILLSAAVAGLGTVTVWGYSLRDIVGSFTVMALALGGGSGLGAAAGVAVGLVVGLVDANATTLISFYAVGGLLAGSLQPLGRFAVVLGFLLGGVITVLHFGNRLEFMQVITETIVAAGFISIVPGSWLRKWRGSFREQPMERMSARNVYEAAAKLSSVAEIFANLAATSSSAVTDSEVKKREYERTRLLSAVGEQVCGPCQRRAKCWEKDFDRTHQNMLEALARAGQANLIVANLPKHLKECCLSSRELTEIVNAVAQHNRTYSFWQKKFAATRRSLAEQLKAVSGIMGNLAGALGQEPVNDNGIAAEIKKKAALINCSLGKVQVHCQQGVHTVELNKNPCSGNRECMNSLLSLTAALLKRKLVLHSECGESFADRKCRVIFRTVCQYSVQTGTASIAKEPQAVCGDTSAVVEVNQGKLALILSDGMGSGSKAAGESKATVEYLKKLLEAGFSVDTAVNMVNNALLLKEPEENFATVDLAIIDSYSGEAEFLKVGAASSYVKRLGEVTTIKSAALPIGILGHIEAEVVKWTLSPGDIIVMVSDGISDINVPGGNKESWLAKYLREAGNVSAQEMADTIMNKAILLLDGSIGDDMTVMVAQISQCPGLGH